MGGSVRIIIYSLRAIAPGEELNYDYKFEYEAEDAKAGPHTTPY